MRDEALDKPTEAVLRQAQHDGPRLQNRTVRPICPGYLEFDRATSLGHVANRPVRLFARTREQRLQSHGAALGQFGPLLILWDHEGFTQSETACCRFDFEQPTIAGALSRMDAQWPGYTCRRPVNRRQAPFFLAEKGGALQLEPTREARAATVVAAADPTRSEPECGPV